MLDYFIKNGFVFDGSGAEYIETNIGIKDDRIAYIGPDALPAKETINAKGLVVSPGFIDTHAHSEFTILADGRAEGKISQGVTTEINGNCGLSAAPLYNEARKRREEDLKELAIEERWATFEEYFDILRNRGIALNFAALCGHGNIRASVIGYKDILPDKSSMDRMKGLLSEALKEGAKGLSTGLIYPPGVYSNTEELIRLCKGHNSEFIYASHMRSEGDRLIEAIEEAVKIGQESGVKVHISHIKTAGEKNWHKVDKAIELMEDARNSGIRLTCDRYPYTATSTDLDAILPAWVYEGGVEEELRRLKDKDIAKKLKEEIGVNSESVWKGIYVSSVSSGENKWMEGENLFDIAMKMEKSPEDAALEIIIKERTRVGAIFFSLNEDNLRRFLLLPYAMIGSDSSVRSFSGQTCFGKPHPRAFGTFPKFLGRYVRDEGLMPLSEAIRKITSLPAITFGLKERGMIREGFYADITIFDYEKLNDTATFKEPFSMALGINYVFVNGVLTFRNGEFTGSRAGRVLI